MMNSQEQKGKKISILGFAGSLRKDSFNKSLLRAARWVLKETRRDYSGWFWRGLKARALRWRSFVFFIISPDKQKQPPILSSIEGKAFSNVPEYMDFSGGVYEPVPRVKVEKV